MSNFRPLGPLVEAIEINPPLAVALVGRYVRLEPISAALHGPALWREFTGQTDLWDYLYEEPPKNASQLISDLQAACAKPDWQGYAISTPNGRVLGYAFYLNIVPQMRSIEVGNINFSSELQRSAAATEAMYLMMKHAFDAGYRRYEWKCNALNAPSRRAAQRLGFSWEGIFRQHLIVKGRNRDTAWFAITDQEWPKLDAAFQTWLAPENFDGHGEQKTRLSCLTAPIRVATDPEAC